MERKITCSDCKKEISRDEMSLHKCMRLCYKTGTNYKIKDINNPICELCKKDCMQIGS